MKALPFVLLAGSVLGLGVALWATLSGDVWFAMAQGFVLMCL